MSYRDGDLYELLPAIHRSRDVDMGGKLEALVSVLGEQADVLDENLRRLYDNWFIETCEPWVVPYLAELLRVRGVHDLGRGDGGARAYTANTLRYRRRKGTVAVLEELARDVTNWQARAAEFFLQLGTTQHVNHLRSEHHRTPDLRNTSVMGRLQTPFDSVGRTVEVRRVSAGRGKHNIANVGIFLWRLEAYPVQAATPRPVSDPGDGRYHFSPLGLDAPLFNLPDTEEEITELADELDVPGPLRRRPLAAEAEARRQAAVASRPSPGGFLRDDGPVIEIFVRNAAGDPLVKVPTDELQICDLEELTPGGEWRRPETTRDYTGPDGSTVTMSITAAVDPERGRLAFPTGVTPEEVRVSYAYGFSGDIGGGPYPRPAEIDGWEAARPGASIFTAVVTSDPDEIVADPTRFMATVGDAITAWNAHSTTGSASYGVIGFADSASYPTAGDPTARIPEGARLAFVAGDPRPGGGLARQPVRPHLLGDLRVVGTAPQDSDDPGHVLVDGLLIEGDLVATAGHLGELMVLHSTMTGDLRVNGTELNPNDRVVVSLDRTIARAVDLAPTIPELAIVDSILAGSGGTAIDAPGADTTLDSVTALGSTDVRSIEAGNCIFDAFVRVERAQVGCVRFSYVAPDPRTRTPRRYRCQPDLALVGESDPSAMDKIRARLVPVFTSRQYGQPGFGQLATNGAAEISTGAEDEAETGAFRFLAQPQRRENLAVALGEYLRFGMEAGVFYVT